GLVVSDGEMTEKQRNALLAEMTDEVGLLVLQDNYYQTQALSIAGRYAAEMLDVETRLMRYLERIGRLNRVIEFLPTDEQINERNAAKQGLTSPERAVLLAYSKMWLYDALLESDVPEDALVAGMLAEYFPQPLRERFDEPMHRHPLRREILATYLTNGLVNRVGCAFVHRMMEETDAQPGDIVRACLMARSVFDLDDVWRRIDALDNRVPDDVQARMFVEITRLLESAALWFLRHLQSGELHDGGAAALIARCRDAAQRLAPQLPALLPAADIEALSERQRVLVDAGVDSDLAVRVASGEIPAALLDIAEVAATSGRSLEQVAGVYFALGTQLNYHWIGERAAALPTPTHWDVMARAAALAELARLKRQLATSALAQAPDASEMTEPDTLVDAWRARRESALARYAQLLNDLRAAGGASLSMLLVVVREMAALERH
ncbi:MAG TPA: NAD-glutamate dehydrogenase domain-containing protein, partial [Paraburkholderia sp.]